MNTFCGCSNRVAKKSLSQSVSREDVELESRVGGKVVNGHTEGVIGHDSHCGPIFILSVNCFVP